MVAARRQRFSVRHLDLDHRLHAGERRVGPHLDLLGGRAPQHRIVVARRLELGERELAVMQDDGGGVMGRDERVELRLVAGELAVQVEDRLVEADAQLLHLGGIDLVPLDEIEQRGIHALDRGGRGPQAQRDLLELPALAEPGGRELGLAAIRIAVVEAAVLGGEEFARRQKILLGQQRRHQARKRAAALVEFHRRGAPGREGAGRLAAGETEGFRHGVGIEATQRADRRRRPKWTQDPRPVPAARAHRRIIRPDADPRRHLEAGRERDQ